MNLRPKLRVDLRGGLARRPLLPLFVLLTLGAAVIAGLILMAARGQDQVAADDGTRLVEAGLSAQLRHLGQANRDYAWWNAMATFTETHDAAWAAREIGPDTLHGLDLSGSMIVDGVGTTVIAFGDAVYSDSGAERRIVGGLQQMIESARSVRGRPKAITGLLLADGVVQIASATAITPSGNWVDQGRRSHVLVFLRPFDGEALHQIRFDYEIRGLRLVPPAAAAGGDSTADRLPLIAFDGTPLAALAWTPERPGGKLVETMLPAIGLAFLAMAVMALLSIRQITAFQRDNHRSHDVIAAQSAELDSAAAIRSAVWNSIDEGIGVFDRDMRLVSWNRRYADIHSLPAEALQAGTGLDDIVRAAAESNASGKRLTAEEIEAYLEAMARRDVQPFEYTDRAGKVIEVRLNPMPDGGFLTAARDITARRRAENEVEHNARHDGLTKLWNRATFVERLNDALAVMARGQGGLAVLYLDLDHFKDINDTLGHPVGDSLLKSVAERLRHVVRTIDTVARFGGDEFAILQSHATDPQGVSVLAERTLSALSQPFLIDGNELHIGTSIGICMPTDPAADAEDVMKKADLALYRAKEDGRGAYCFYEPDMNAMVHQRVSIAADLRHALQNGELFLEYQPQVDMRDGSPVGLEALVRWRHPERGILMPATFIAIAETTGLIGALGGWVLREAMAQGRRWLDQGLPVPTIAVNVSTLQVRGPDIEREVEAALAASGFPAELLELEITESAVLQVTQAHRGLLERWHDRGIRIAIDDFGTGFSSLEYLRVLQVDRLKIAMEFVRGVDTDRNSAAITRAAIQLAVALDLTPIAEGVETLAEAEFLLRLGCHQAQGFLYSRPLPAEAVTDLLRQPARSSAPIRSKAS